MSKHFSDVRSAVGKVRGGVRVLHHKNTANCPIVRVPVPQQVVLPMQMHIGTPCTPIVKTGDNVSAGQMIGQIPEKALGAPVHASVSGQVTEVNDKYIAIRRV